MVRIPSGRDDGSPGASIKKRTRFHPMIPAENGLNYLINQNFFFTFPTAYSK